jgi:hypothetical protein
VFLGGEPILRKDGIVLLESLLLDHGCPSHGRLTHERGHDTNTRLTLRSGISGRAGNKKTSN